MSAAVAPAGGHLHEGGFYRSDSEFAELIVGFVDSAVAAGEPVIIGFDERKNELIRSHIADDAGVGFIEGAALYTAPTRAIASYQRQFEKHIAEGATRIRIAGDVPHPGNGGAFVGWDRYEAGINTLWRELPVWSRCLYDATTVPAAVRDVVVRTHPQLVTPDGRATRNADYDHHRQGAAFLPVPPDPLEDSAPTQQLVGCSPGAARNAIRALGSGHVYPTALDDIVYAASEAVVNAHQHGRPPITVRIWRADQRMLVTVHDTGPGPRDRTVGLAPRTRTTTGAGLGLWIAHQLDVTTDLVWHDEGFTVRMSAPVEAGGPPA